ncbi:MAG: nicotinate (nicotinamide) nucleotide adenylyltransferase [Solirubrobacteraceae bacterium]
MSALSDAGTGLGVLGGTFNPPHRGHLRLARAALDELGLTRVLLVPARAAPHKSSDDDPGVEHRLRMCELAAAVEPRVEVSRIELDRPGLSYTVDTLRSIHATDPDAELTLIVGADMAQTLPSWREPEEILRLARLAVAGRDGVARREQTQSTLAGLGADARTVFLDMPLLDISSSQVRARVAAAEPCEDLVGAEVAGYIAEHALYTEGDA